MNKTNKDLQKARRMPKNATFEQRVTWHAEHQKHCQCRPIPKKLAGEMEMKGIKF